MITSKHAQALGRVFSDDRALVRVGEPKSVAYEFGFAPGRRCLAVFHEGMRAIFVICALGATWWDVRREIIEARRHFLGAPYPAPRASSTLRYGRSKCLS